ncbi:hypothetical protein [Pseudomaricurvus sp. HS19]|uniref:hypothetical protein n=1 Tax=Pseudomaricurvus sp. HS19 TaxID=2692626 RepID=UPI00136F9014|nr:hypothetical protein [Pseudomaricurvus sp. HS19]MYM64078.1 hypothetical protein [Pseudomaricurvus sp. HS19]
MAQSNDGDTSETSFSCSDAFVSRTEQWVGDCLHTDYGASMVSSFRGPGHLLPAGMPVDIQGFIKPWELAFVWLVWQGGSGTRLIR